MGGSKAKTPSRWFRSFRTCVSVDDLDDDLTSVSELATSMLEENQLTIDPEAVDEVDPTSERTLLHTAANDGDLNLVVRLLEIGAEIERSDRNGQTALNLGKSRHLILKSRGNLSSFAMGWQSIGFQN